jgi:ESS family glutamate:Na+ symporter
LVTFRLDMISTLALAALVLMSGYRIRRRIRPLARYNIPAPVVGGFLFAALVTLLRNSGLLQLEFDTALQIPLMIAFFTTIGLGASRRLLKVGGPQMLLFLLLASTLAVIQNTVGIGLAHLMRVDPLLGLISGSITMTGGHGTGAAFGRLLEDQYGFPGAFTLAMAAATFGLVCGGLLGGPVGTRLIERLRGVAGEGPERKAAPDPDPAGLPAPVPGPALHGPEGGERSPYALMKSLTVILAAMWAGSLVSRWLGHYVTLPAYIGAMLVAALLRNGDDLLRRPRIDARLTTDLGIIALDLFLAMALMSLRLWELLDLALPMLVILAVQVVLMGLFAWLVTYRLMGRDYEAAVMAGGHCGFGLGATPNAVANMEALVERFGPAPRAFLVVPLVGAFFIDFTNALIITGFIDLLR